MRETHVADRIIRTAFTGPPTRSSWSSRKHVYAAGYDTEPVYLENDEAEYVAEVFARPFCWMCEDFIEVGAPMLTVTRGRSGQLTYCERHALEQGYGRASDA